MLVCPKSHACMPNVCILTSIEIHLGTHAYEDEEDFKDGRPLDSAMTQILKGTLKHTLNQIFYHRKLSKGSYFVQVLMSIIALWSLTLDMMSFHTM